ncbi:MAG: hypothetical protein D6754_06055 [Alphaproteobacteria bacterium]|nr:MAG: hypothetical protein D6754_06055 [Alphaproteobacteria bacterium]
MARRTLHIHAGLPKTGSSALQRFLADNRDALMEQGLFIPRTGQRADGPHHVLMARLGGVLGRGRAAHAEALAQEILAADAPAALISSEYAVPLLRATRLGRSLDRLRAEGIAIRFHLFLRPQPDLLNSAYPEILRSTLTHRSFEAFLAERMRARSRHYSVLIGGLERASDLAPVLHPFSAPRRRAGIWIDLLQGLGISPQARRWLRPGIVNPSLGPIGTYTLQRVIQRIERRGMIRGLSNRRALRDAISRASRRFPAELAPFCGLDNALRDRIWEGAAEDNEAIARRWWGQGWDEVFAEERVRDWRPNRFRPRRTGPAEHELAEEMMEIAWRACRRAARSWAERSAARRLRDRLMDPVERFRDLSLRLGITYG